MWILPEIQNWFHFQVWPQYTSLPFIQVKTIYASLPLSLSLCQITENTSLFLTTQNCKEIDFYLLWFCDKLHIKAL